MELQVAKTSVYFPVCEGRVQRAHAVLQPHCSVHGQVHGKKKGLVINQKYHEGTETK